MERGMKRVFPLLVVACIACVPLAATAASHDVTLRTSTGPIYGVLDVPDGATSPMPVALVIASTGQTDRNGDSSLNVTADTYRMLADDLAARGIATLRYDKRGVGQSSTAVSDPGDLTFDAYVSDADDWIRYLRRDKRFSRVAIVGHGEGSIVGLYAAQKVPVDAFVSVAGAGRPLGDVIVGEIAAQPGGAGYVRPARDAVNEIKDGETPDDLPSQLVPLFPPNLTKFLSQFFNADPTTAAHDLTIPLAVVQGTDDIESTELDAHLLADAHAGAVLTIVPRMTHVLKDASDDSRGASIATYTNRRAPLDPAAVDAIAAGIAATK